MRLFGYLCISRSSPLDTRIGNEVFEYKAGCAEQRLILIEALGAFIRMLPTLSIAPDVVPEPWEYGGVPKCFRCASPLKNGLCQNYGCESPAIQKKVLTGDALAHYSPCMPRIPKDLSKYIPSFVAAYRLIDLTLQQILGRPRAKIKWQLKLWIYYPPEALEGSEALVVPTMGTFSSGDYEEASPPDPTVSSKEPR